MGSNIIGQTLLNQFRVDALLAVGRTGAVYRVWDLKREIPLAMKMLHRELAEAPAFFKRAERIYALRKGLAHNNIVPPYGLYQSQDTAFMLERFIDGPTLKVILHQRKGKPLSADEALIFLKALCAALGYAHSNGIMHCDVKPGNVMVDRERSIFLTDFGIALLPERIPFTIGTGNPAYMAPEQIRGDWLSPATDIYALEVVLFEMLTGQCPFRGNEAGTGKSGSNTIMRISYGHLNLTPPDPRGLNPDLPAGMSTVLFKALKKQPQQRFRSTHEFHAMARVAAGQKYDLVADSFVPLLGKE